MVRLLKVKELEDRKQFLIAQSEMYRQTLKLEVANIKFSAALQKRRLKSPKSILMLLGLVAAPAAGFMFYRKQKPKAPPEPKEQGLLPKLMIGLQLVRRFAPLLQKLSSRARAPAVKRRPPPRQNLTQYP